MAFLVNFSRWSAGASPASGLALVVASFIATESLPPKREKREPLGAANSPPNPRRASAAIQDRENANNVRLDAIINRKGKKFTQTPMISKQLRVNAALNAQ